MADPVVELDRAAIDQPPAIVEAGAFDQGIIVAGGRRRDFEIAAVGVAVSQVIDDVDLAERAAGRHLVIEEAAELARARGMLELAQRLGLDLADALAGHRELLADLFQRVIGVHADAEAHAQHALLARRKAGQHPRGGLAQIGLDRGVDGEHRVLVLDEIAEIRIFLIADRGFERDRLLGELLDQALDARVVELELLQRG
jgi:hypothetical protein